MNKLVGFTYNKDGKASNYIYRRNLQGDIIGIYDSLGNEVGGYAYDAYGKCYVKYKDNSSEEEKTILNTNPFRYRGYYYDNETGLYYLNARYYDPNIGRFISPDVLTILDETRGQINGLNLYMYCNNNPIMYVDPSGCLAKWANWILGGLIIVGGIALSIMTGGLAAPLTAALGGSFIASIAAGAIVGAVGGAIAGACLSIGSQAISNGFENIRWSDVGKSALNGAISGAISGGIFGGIKYAVNTTQIANSLAGVNSAQARLDSAFLSLKNVKNLSNLPFSGSNITRVIVQAAANYNSAYSSLIMAQINSKLIELAIKAGLSGTQFGLKQLIGYALNQIW